MTAGIVTDSFAPTTVWKIYESVLLMGVGKNAQ